MLTTTPVFQGGQYSTDEVAHLPRLFCDAAGKGYWNYVAAFQGTDESWEAVSKDFHVMPVRYFGRLVRPDKWLVSWRCQRGTAGLRCNALN